MKNEEVRPVRCGCGGEAKIEVASGYDPFAEKRKSNLWYGVICEKCKVQTKAYYTEAEAITAWNRAMGDHFRDVTKKGEWLWDEEEDRCYCSECGEEDDLSIDGVYMMHDFCPNCGADMRKG